MVWTVVSASPVKTLPGFGTDTVVDRIEEIVAYIANLSFMEIWVFASHITMGGAVALAEEK